MKVAIRKPIQKARTLAASRLVHLFAVRFGFVYFEQLDARANPGQFVTGFTISPTQQDRHYMVGHMRGFDLTAVERHATLSHSSHPSQLYKWLIMQIDMPGQQLPQAYLATYRHSPIFYSVLLQTLRRLEHANHFFSSSEPLFTKYFSVFAAPEDVNKLRKLLTSGVTTMLGYHFRQFEYELNGDHLRIYATNVPTNPTTLQEMLRVGMWLAEQFAFQDAERKVDLY